MRRRVFANVAKRAWWQVHVDAWRKSGLSMTAYCFKHRLTRETFQAWRDELTDWEAQKTVQTQMRTPVLKGATHRPAPPG